LWWKDENVVFHKEEDEDFAEVVLKAHPFNSLVLCHVY
jgi:hypothetical protein